MVELKTHAGWNTCNPSLLLGFNLRSAGTYILRTPTIFHFIFMAGTHTPTNQHIHTSHVTPIHTLSTIRHYSFPFAVHPVHCFVVCYMDSLISFELFFYVFRLLCLTIQPSSQLSGTTIVVPILELTRVVNIIKKIASRV